MYKHKINQPVLRVDSMTRMVVGCCSLFNSEGKCIANKIGKFSVYSPLTLNIRDTSSMYFSLTIIVEDINRNNYSSVPLVVLLILHLIILNNL